MNWEGSGMEFVFGITFPFTTQERTDGGAQLNNMRVRAT